MLEHPLVPTPPSELGNDAEHAQHPMRSVVERFAADRFRFTAHNRAFLGAWLLAQRATKPDT